MKDPSLAALIKRAIDERAWRDCHLLFQTPHDPQDLEKAEAELEARFRSLIREEVSAMFRAEAREHDDGIKILPL